MATIHTGNRRALRRRGGPILGIRKVRGGATISTKRLGGMYVMTIFPRSTIDQIMQNRRTPVDIPHVQMPIVSRSSTDAETVPNLQDMRTMFRSPGEVEIITIGKSPPSSLNGRMKRQLRAMGVDMSTLR